MESLINKFAAKLVEAGLADPGTPLLGGLDADLTWTHDDPAIPILSKVFDGLNINSLLYCRPAEPFASIIDYLSRLENEIYPRDAETRTFLHSLPVAKKLEASMIIAALERRKSVIIRGGAIVTFGTVSPEQAFVVFSSVCFACFVKFFSDLLEAKRTDSVDPLAMQVFEKAATRLPSLPKEVPPLMTAPFTNETMVQTAMIQAGRQMVKHRMVDSFFGNISHLKDGVLYISQTGSSLDELEGCIDPCPLDGSQSTGMTASSELQAHLKIVHQTNIRSILHGHPKFAVIISLDCDKRGCVNDGECHLRCAENRLFEDIPIIPGEVGTGRFGIARTLPPALKGRRGAIVYGHGLFTIGKHDFNEAFATMLDVERNCQSEFFSRMGFSETPTK
jgi:ribulose-5-phosphate 4-epimerase/fuculose-1-phosphate aldolase